MLKKDANSTEKEKFNYEFFAYQESFRNLYTSIKFINSDNPLKVINITSSISKEGKTLINILLANLIRNGSKNSPYRC